VLARAEQSLEPFDLVAEQLLEQVRRPRSGRPDLTQLANDGGETIH
jgi:hypothetical protein